MQEKLKILLKQIGWEEEKYDYFHEASLEVWPAVIDIDIAF